MYIRKSVLIGVTIVATLVGCIAITIAQEESTASHVIYFPHQNIAAAFTKGGTLIQGMSGAAKYRILTARRDKPGKVEIHDVDTDIIYAQSGTATFVTGGTPVAPRDTSPGEIRARSIQGGQSYFLSKGDVIIVPPGVPHWFKEVQAPFLYYVVKVR